MMCKARTTFGKFLNQFPEPPKRFSAYNGYNVHAIPCQQFFAQCSNHLLPFSGRLRNITASTVNISSMIGAAPFSSVSAIAISPTSNRHFTCNTLREYAGFSIAITHFEHRQCTSKTKKSHPVTSFADNFVPLFLQW